MSDRRRLLALLLLHSTVTQVITFVLRPTSAYRAIELGVSPTWLGALTASFAVIPLLLAVPSGQATDRFGERRVMLAGAVLMALSGAPGRRGHCWLSGPASRSAARAPRLVSTCRCISSAAASASPSRTASNSCRCSAARASSSSSLRPVSSPCRR